MNCHEKWLRQAAKEIREEGHAGWGNTCEWAADEIARLEAKLSEQQSVTRVEHRCAKHSYAGPHPCEICESPCKHEFRPIDSSGQLACVWCNSRYRQEFKESEL